MTIGMRMKAARERSNMTAKRLSEVTGVPENSIYRIEKGEVENPGVGTLKKLLIALGCSADEIIFGEDELIADGSLKRAFVQSSNLKQKDIEVITRIAAALSTIETMESHLKDQDEEKN